MHVLIAEDDTVSARLLERILCRQGHRVSVVADGREALELCRRQPFDVLLTDWMMPHMDGLELIRQLRAGNRPMPYTLVVTSLDSHTAREHALQAGADDYLAKPFHTADLVGRLEAGLARSSQPVPPLTPVAVRPAVSRAPFVGVGIATSTGGPEALKTLLRGLSPTSRAAFFAVAHGPGWMLETLAGRLALESRLPVCLAAEGMAVKPGQLYLAPGERHLQINHRSLTLHLSDGPPENYVRPAADPLFRSLAESFGRHCIAVVLTGLGRDGALGAVQIASAGGTVLAQSPATAVAASMPQTVVDAGIVSTVAPVERLAPALEEAIRRLQPARLGLA